MKKMIIVTLFVLSLSMVAFAEESVKEPEFSDTSTIEVEKKKPTPEEIAAYQKTVAEARKRDAGEIRAFTNTSSVCAYSMLQSQLDEWLIKFPKLVVDSKEYLSPSYKVKRVSSYDGSAHTECITTLVVHYHEKSWWKFWE